MALCVFVCNGCGKQEESHDFDTWGRAIKPAGWYSRGDKDGCQLACSRDCIQTVSEETGKTSVVLPF